MDKALLVGIDVEIGERILKALDEAKLNIKVALWFYSPEEYSDWRLMFSSRRFDQLLLPDAFGLLQDALNVAGITYEETPTLMILPTTNPFIKELRRRFGKARNVQGMRIGPDVYGDRYIEEGYVYRIS